ncbi:D-2-hydroxyacid dehydrogenase [Helicobacter sp. MIT 00-7814]|uniref:D-2-hydroxyacid dehydrogenase n=1 Tax=unclassified Helicobacter TaxID=2593540 RepID=UPI000E1E6910|nr:MULTISPECIES: D-2-hydroxyacid dehydrogenase [unclassified Helicobacter]RDU57156.1 D-2-hydroxyacid dehydrogenase [Helicobacter sp. MIT 00-7814]RDU57708.1 D-2-hydroxyacid dehydrogenase [Helicobacter sp. MIT 99-10781]
MKANIVFLDSQTLGECDLSVFESLGNFTHYPVTSPNEVIERAKEAQIVLTNKVVLDSQILENLPNLKLICIVATGMNNVDLECAKAKGIAVKNVAGYSTNAVAQHTLMLALSFLGNLPYYERYCKNGEWVKSQTFTHIKDPLLELDCLQWGIIGLGSIGNRVAKLASAFGAKVSYFSTSGKNSNATYPQKSLEEILSTSDVISIHAPLNSATKNLLNSGNLKLLKKHAILLNMGRGGIVNEEDIAKELESRELYFGADVLENEPMKPNHPLLNPKIAHKILLTPHIAWAYDKARVRLIEGVVANIKSFGI